MKCDEARHGKALKGAPSTDLVRTPLRKNKLKSDTNKLHITTALCRRKGGCFLLLGGFFSKTMELLWRFGGCRRVKWKGKWKSLYWNFIITRKTTFANEKREEFTEMLRFCIVSIRQSEILQKQQFSHPLIDLIIS